MTYEFQFELIEMRFISPQELLEIFGPTGFTVDASQSWYRMALVLDLKISSHQKKIGGRPTPRLDRMVEFIEALNRWLPSSRRRLLWVDHWSNSFPSTHALFVMMRTGLGERRPISDAPGLLFEAYPYHERDQVRIPAEQAAETGTLIGLTALLMMNRWDGWLIAEGSSDRIEFWEGNFFFHSAEDNRLEEGEHLMKLFECPRDLI